MGHNYLGPDSMSVEEVAIEIEALRAIEMSKNVMAGQGSNTQTEEEGEISSSSASDSEATSSEEERSPRVQGVNEADRSHHDSTVGSVETEDDDDDDGEGEKGEEEEKRTIKDEDKTDENVQTQEGIDNNCEGRGDGEGEDGDGGSREGGDGEGGDKEGGGDGSRGGEVDGNRKGKGKEKMVEEEEPRSMEERGLDDDAPAIPLPDMDDEDVGPIDFSSLMNYRMRWDFTGKTELEVGKIVKGTMVQLLDDTDPDWWEIVAMDGTKGYVPAKYVGKDNRRKKEKEIESKQRVAEWCSTWKEGGGQQGKKKRSKVKRRSSNKGKGELAQSEERSKSPPPPGLQKSGGHPMGEAVSGKESTSGKRGKHKRSLSAKKIRGGGKGGADSGPSSPVMSSTTPNRDKYIKRKELLSLPPGIAIKEYEGGIADGLVGSPPGVRGGTGHTPRDYIGDEEEDERVTTPLFSMTMCTLKEDHQFKLAKFDEFMKSKPSKKELLDTVTRFIASLEPEGIEKEFVVVRYITSIRVDRLIDLDILAGGLMHTAFKHNNTLDLAKTMVELDVRQTDNEVQLFRGNSMATKALGEFLWIYGKAFLAQTLKPILFSLVHGKKTFQIDPSKEPNEIKLEENTENLLATLEMTISMICNSVDRVPVMIRRLCHFIAVTVGTKFEHDYADDKNLFKFASVRKALVNFFFFRFICPAITDPQTYQVRN